MYHKGFLLTYADQKTNVKKRNVKEIQKLKFCFKNVSFCTLRKFDYINFDTESSYILPKHMS